MFALALAAAPALAQDEPYLARPPTDRFVQWIVAEPLLYVGTLAARGSGTNNVGGGALVRLFTLRWRHAYLTLAEGGGAAGIDSFFFAAGMSAGLDFKLGRRDQHHLRLGLGAHFAGFLYRLGGDDMSGSVGLAVTPEISYLYEYPGGMVIGASWRALCPVHPREDPGDYAAALSFGFLIGI